MSTLLKSEPSFSWLIYAFLLMWLAYERVEKWHAAHGCQVCVVAQSEVRDGVRVLQTRHAK